MADSSGHQEEPLLLWAKSCAGLGGLQSASIHHNQVKFDFTLLCDGHLLNSIMAFIDSRSARPDQTSSINDTPGRLRNLAFLLRNIQNYYKDVLNQIIVMPLPDLVALARNPYFEQSGDEMKKVVLLLLGCAVQSDKKEQFINRIKQLELSLQHAIAEQIKKITCDAECVLNIQVLEVDPADANNSTVLHQLQKVVLERDHFTQNLFEEVCQENENSDANSNASASGEEMCPTKLPESQQHDGKHTLMTEQEKHHFKVELADSKAKLRRARQDLEEKMELLGEYKDELQEKDAMLSKLRQDNLELLKDARAATIYRDELDIYREKASKVDRLEAEGSRFRQKLGEFEFYKARVEEQRIEQESLFEARKMLETQLEAANSRSEQNQQAEQQLLHSQRKIHELQQELEHERSLVVDLMKDNSRLEQEQGSARRRAKTLEEEVEQWQRTSGPGDGGSSLSDQLKDSQQNKMIQLEAENQQLRDLIRNGTAESLTRNPSGSSVATVVHSPRRAKVIPTPGKIFEQSFTKQIDPPVSIFNDAIAPDCLLDSPGIISLNESIDMVHMEARVASMSRELERATKDRDLAEGRMAELVTRVEVAELEKQRAQDKLSVNAKDNELEMQEALANITNMEQMVRVLKEKQVVLEGNEQDMTNICSKLQLQIKSQSAEKSTLNYELESALNRCEAAEKDRLASQEAFQKCQDKIYELERLKLETDTKLYGSERSTKNLEKENARFKQLVEQADADYEEARAQLVELERERQRANTEKRFVEQQSTRTSELEIETRLLSQQLELEHKKMAALREDLVGEKTKQESTRAEIRAIAVALGVNGAEIGFDFDKLRLLERIHANKLDNKRTCDDLNARISIANQDREEVLKQLSELQQRKSSSVEINFSNSKSLQSACLQTDPDASVGLESHSRTKELEAKNNKLCEENRYVKDQVYLLQEQVRKTQIHSQTMQVENAGFNKELSELRAQKFAHSTLQSENARLAVEARSLQLQVKVLEADSRESQLQLQRIERDDCELGRSFEQLQNQHCALLHDHETLQNLHTSLAKEHDALCKENSDIRSQVKQFKLEYHGQVEKNDVLARQHEEVVRMKQKLETEKAKFTAEIHGFTKLQSENGAIKRQHEEALHRRDQLKRENESMRAEYRVLKSQHHKDELTSTQMHGQLSQSQHEVRQKEMELVRLENKCLMLDEINMTLRDELKSLAQQMETLIEQNRELLSRALSDKDNHHAEEKDLAEKLNALKRQKEKLEEKIMDQYKLMGSPHKKKPSFIRRAKALISRSESRKQSSPFGMDIHFPATSSGTEDSGSYVSDHEAAAMRRQRQGSGGAPQLFDENELFLTPTATNRNPGESDICASKCVDNNFDQLSWIGSERAVDVPDDPKNQTKASNHRPKLPPPAPAPSLMTRNGNTGRIAVPPPLPARQSSMRRPPPPPAPPYKSNAMANRLPPPYPGKMPTHLLDARANPTSTDQYSSFQLVASTSFETPNPTAFRTSTPKDVTSSTTEETSPVVKMRPSKRASRFPLSDSKGDMPPDFPTDKRSINTCSLYENLDDVQSYLSGSPSHNSTCIEANNSREETAILEGHIVSNVKDHSVWYEYGCV